MICDRPRDGVKISRARVIAQALPRTQDVIFGSASQKGEIGEAAEPLIVIRDHCRDLSLLEHELGDENCVWIARSAPGEVAAVAAIPRKKKAMESADLFRFGNRLQQTLNVQRPKLNVQFRVERWALSVERWMFSLE